MFSFDEKQRALNAYEIHLMNGFEEVSSFWPESKEDGEGYIQLVKKENK